MSKVDRADIREEVAASIRNFSQLARDDAARQRMVIDMPDFIKQKAALISAHFLLPAGARVVDMGCETGEITYMLAVLNPRIEFIGVDRDAESVAFARKTYRLPNLSYRLTDIAIPDLEDASVDGIINSNVLHQVYSTSGYNPDEVAALLERQIQKLKPGGTMLVRDYVMPRPDEYVLMELPNLPSAGSDPLTLSDADLLVAFSQTARPMVSGCEGFFIEELMPRKDGTRLFRLPHKWANEFIHRKDNRRNWMRDLHEECTFYTWPDFRREFSRLGMRMVFSAPYWNPWVVQHCFKGRFQLYDENYEPRNPPATNYFIVAQKVADKQSLLIEERRPSQNPASNLQIMVVRDKKSGKLHELVRRPGDFCDVIPYRITADNRLVVYVRSGFPRPIVNAVGRGSHNLDGKKWSGHLIEPISMDTTVMTTDVDVNRGQIFDHIKGYAGLRPKADDRWFVGNTYFPSPDTIDEAIEPVFIEVENPQRTSWTAARDGDTAFTEAGTITELDANDIIFSSQVGLLPDPRLEMYIFELMSRYEMPLPRWLGEEMPEIEREAVRAHEPEELLEELEKTEFEEVKSGPVHLRAVKSVFVEEGRVGRAMRGLSAQDVEFIVSDEGVENIAVVVPLTRDWDDNLLVALEPQIMPVPNRLGGDGAMLNMPSFKLPSNVRNVTDARQFIADKFRIPLDNVEALGQSYFTHTGVTPQRIYPFMITAPDIVGSRPQWRLAFVKSLIHPRKGLGNFIRQSQMVIKAMARLAMRDEASFSVGYTRGMEQSRVKDYQLSTDKVAVDMRFAHHSAIPSRILGQRAPDAAPVAAPVPVMPAAPVAAAPAKPAVDVAETKAETPVVPPRVGKRLIECYAEAKSVMRAGTAPITLQETPAVKEIEKDIDTVAKKIRSKPEAGELRAPPRPKAPAPKPAPLLDLLTPEAKRR